MFFIVSTCNWNEIGFVCGNSIIKRTLYAETSEPYIIIAGNK